MSNFKIASFIIGNVFFQVACHAALPNPLMAPKPAATSAQSGGDPVPANVRASGSGNTAMQQNNPMSVPSGSPQAFGSQNKNTPVEVDLNAVPEELYALEDKWFVSAIMENAAILRPSEGAATGATKSPTLGANPMQNMGGAGSFGGTTGTTSAAPSSVMKSLLLVNGTPFVLRGKSLNVSVKDGMVSLNYVTAGGKSMLVYRSGVDIYSVKRESQTTKETPNSTYAGSMIPSINGNATGTGTGTGSGTGTSSPGTMNPGTNQPMGQ